MAAAPPLRKTIEDLSAIFKKYAGEDGNDKTLTKAEAKKLLLGELPELLENPNDDAKINESVNDLDMDGDGVVDFMEFMILVLTLGIAHYDPDLEAE